MLDQRIQARQVIGKVKAISLSEGDSLRWQPERFDAAVNFVFAVLRVNNEHLVRRTRKPCDILTERNTGREPHREQALTFALFAGEKGESLLDSEALDDPGERGRTIGNHCSNVEQP